MTFIPVSQCGQPCQAHQNTLILSPGNKQATCPLKLSAGGNQPQEQHYKHAERSPQNVCNMAKSKSHRHAVSSELPGALCPSGHWGTEPPPLGTKAGLSSSAKEKLCYFLKNIDIHTDRGMWYFGTVKLTPVQITYNLLAWTISCPESFSVAKNDHQGKLQIKWTDMLCFKWLCQHFKLITA